MAQNHRESPYTTREEQTAPQYALPESAAYAVPNPNAENYTLDSPIGAYAVASKEEIGNTPDPFRLKHIRQLQTYAEAGKPPEDYYRPIDADDAFRHSVETIDADGWEEMQGTSLRFADNPRENPAPVGRLTALMAPRSYWFTRPMFGAPRALNGEHFSMADHRRTYDILGTQPVRTWRNTYRIDPSPWDGGLIDVPPNEAAPVAMGIQSIDVPQDNDRSFRLR